MFSSRTLPNLPNTAESVWDEFIRTQEERTYLMMNLTPQIEAILDSLADLCCEAVSSNMTLQATRRDKLVQSLAANGWEQHSEGSKPIWVIVKQRARKRHPEPAMHRGAALESVAMDCQRAYDAFTRYRTSAS